MKVSYAKGKTINMGAFNSLRLDISCELDVIEGESTIEGCLADAKAFVEKELAKAEAESTAV